ncbi:MAG: DsrE family protein [Acidithiobacillus sp.]|nr:DsrE family protein [Acidithiobacillus sp.]
MSGIVFHIDDPSAWSVLMGNLRNSLGEPSLGCLRIVANGTAPVALWADSRWRRELEELLSQGVEAYFCQNSLAAMDLDPAGRPLGSKVVPAGVRAIAEAQEAGFSYLKP